MQINVADRINKNEPVFIYKTLIRRPFLQTCVINGFFSRLYNDPELYTRRRELFKKRSLKFAVSFENGRRKAEGGSIIRLRWGIFFERNSLESPKKKESSEEIVQCVFEY